MADLTEYKTKVRDIIARQRAYFATGETKGYEFRIEKLKALKVAIEKYETDILNALQADLGKSTKESFLTETSVVVNELKLHINKLDDWMEPIKVSTPIEHMPSKSYKVCEPLGEILMITPWNYPFHLSMFPLVGAISAGNCVILKPSPKVPETNKMMSKIISEVFKPEHVTIVEGGYDETLALASEKFDTIFYTGNAEFGKKVMHLAADNLTPVILELGGKSPCVVDLDCNIEVSAKRIAWGKYLNAGQTCVAPDYVMVHKKIVKPFVKELKHCIREFYGKDAKRSPFYPKIINADAVNRLASYLNDGEVIFGGDYNPDERYFAPTLMRKIKEDSPITKEEIFGPILPIYTFEDIQETVDYINARPKPLAVYYFGESKPAMKFLNATSSGTACINDIAIQLANPRLPFGGVGESGFGKYHGPYSFYSFSNEKSYMVSYFKIDNIFKYVPFKFFAITKRIVKKSIMS